MPADDSNQRGFSLKRWSQRKLEAARDVPASPEPLTPPPATHPTLPVAAVPASASTSASIPQETPLPPIESLSIDSDFTAFMQPKVDEALKRQALKQLFRDPRFNVMDGLDTYIDDYTKFTPIEPEVARNLAHARSIFFPTATRVNAQGIVEDVPADEAALADSARDALRQPEPDHGALGTPAVAAESAIVEAASTASIDDTSSGPDAAPTDGAVVEKQSQQ